MQVSASNRKQPPAATASGFLLPYVRSYVCVHDSLLLRAAFLETVLCGHRAGPSRRQVSQGGKKRSWDEVRGKRDPLTGGYGSWKALTSVAFRQPHGWCGAELAPAGGPGPRGAASPGCWRRDDPAKGARQPAEGRRTLAVTRGSGVSLRSSAPSTRTAGPKGEMSTAGGFVEPGTAPGKGCMGCSSHLGSSCPSVFRCISPTSAPSPEVFTAALLRRRAAAVLREGSPRSASPGRTGPGAEGWAVRCPPAPRGALLRAGV